MDAPKRQVTRFNKPGLLQKVFLGPRSTFHNSHRLWLYLGFLVVMVVIIAYSAMRS